MVDLHAIRDRLRCMDLLPWTHRMGDHVGLHSVRDSHGGLVASTGYGPNGGYCDAAAEFIAHAPTDIEALLAEVDETAVDKAAVLREVADEWADATWQDVFAAAKVDDDVSAAIAVKDWLYKRANQFEVAGND